MTRVLILAACLALGCDEGAEPVRSEPCPAYCGIREYCGYSTADCEQECSALRDLMESHSGCRGIGQVLECLSSSPDRVECGETGANLELAGCPGAAAVEHCLMPPAPRAGASLEPDAASTTCPAELVPIELGTIDPTNHDRSVFDGLETFLSDLGEDAGALPEGSVVCGVVEERSGVYDVTASLRSGSVSFSISGLLRATGEKDVRYLGDAEVVFRVDPALEGWTNPIATPCQLTVLADQAVKAGAVWANFSCPWFGAEDCAVSGTILFENCHGPRKVDYVHVVDFE